MGRIAAYGVPGASGTSPITGSGAATQIAYFSSANAITGTAGFTFDGTTVIAPAIGIYSGVGTASTPFSVRRDNAGITRAILASNQSASGSAYAQASLASDAGDFNIDAISVAGGAVVEIRCDAGFTAGMNIRPAAGALKLQVGATTYATASSGTLAIGTATTITNSSGPHLTIVDGGTFGTNADPHIQFNDFAGAGGQVGFYNGASNDLYLRNSRATGDTIVSALQQVILNSGGGNTFRATAGGVAISSIAGFGNNAAASGPVGNVVGKIRVTDGSGSYIGYLAVYDAIT